MVSSYSTVKAATSMYSSHDERMLVCISSSYFLPATMKTEITVTHNLAILVTWFVKMLTLYQSCCSDQMPLRKLMLHVIENCKVFFVWITWLPVTMCFLFCFATHFTSVVLLYVKMLVSRKQVTHETEHQGHWRNFLPDAVMNGINKMNMLMSKVWFLASWLMKQPTQHALTQSSIVALNWHTGIRVDLLSVLCL